AGSDIAAPRPPSPSPGRAGSPRTGAHTRGSAAPAGRHSSRSRCRPQARGDPAAAALGRPCGGAGGRVCERFPRPRPSLRGAVDPSTMLNVRERRHSWTLSLPHFDQIAEHSQTILRMSQVSSLCNW
ncbi:hypothetical protein DV515_00003705, partial [Chloebia gouldiae]